MIRMCRARCSLCQKRLIQHIYGVMVAHLLANLIRRQENIDLTRPKPGHRELIGRKADGKRP